MMASTELPDGLTSSQANTELASQRTAMSFDRTAFASDRTLMAVVRTALALIGFGFTIFQFFHKLNDQFMHGKLPELAPRRFGAALIILGIVLLVLGIFNHIHETHERRSRRQALYDAKLIPHLESKRLNSSMLIAVLLLITGIFAALRVVLSLG